MIEELARPEVIEFILQHETEDPAQLILSHSKTKDLPIALAAAQIQSRKKAKTKLPEWYASQGVLFPHGIPIEQCSSEITAKYKATLIQGNSLIDLTGGTGIDTYYLSKQFQSTSYVEQNQELCDLALHNFGALNSKIDVINSSAENFIATLKTSIDWIYIDPARRDKNKRKVFRIEDCTPNLIELQDILQEKSKGVLIKYSPLLDISEITRSVPNIDEIHIVSANNECKELLIVLKKSSTDIKIRTINFQGVEKQIFNFLPKEENECSITLSLPKQYLYEPNSSIMKAGAFKIIAKKFNLNKLHANSHLYTSEKLVENFPGRVFKIIGMDALKKKVIKKIIPNAKANISTRNFPLSVQEIKKKLEIRDGGNIYIFATTLMNNKHVLIVCNKA
ncbi:MAG: 16S rRNA G966 N2-methylase RsmD [Cyclobacteriaceae bacterium]